MLNVLLTVDTEIWPLAPDWRESHLALEVERYIHGITPEGAFGLPFQLEMLRTHGLKAVFFVEALFGCAVGLDLLRQIVTMIQEHGHEVQLHLHTEWLERLPTPLLGKKTGQHIKDFSEDEQTQLIAQGIQNLMACGVARPQAFRAGNYGANLTTLRALARNGIVYDTSHNACYLNSICAISTPDLLLQPQRLHGVYEFPITCFRDWPGHYRPLQLCACSSQELEHILLHSWKSGWYACVLVSHNFEFLKRPIVYDRPASANSIVIKRFERLCRFLACHREQFRTVGFMDLAPETISTTVPDRPLASGIHRTAWRVAEQLIGRVL